MTCADRIRCHNQRARDRLPNREGPISNYLGKAIRAPSFVSGRDYLDIGETSTRCVAQFRYELCPIIQASIPRNNRAGSGDIRLRFTKRLFRGMEGAIQNTYTALAVNLIAIRTVWS